MSYAGLFSSAQVVVEQASSDRGVQFRRDVMPVFLRAGCNSGSCHGAARGKDGFRLSLFGFDPEGDYFRITREIGARRVNLAMPEQSLLIEKATGKVPHTGGKLFADDSEYGKTLLEWLQAGALNEQGDSPKVVGVDLYPPQVVLEGSEERQQFIAVARYSDGTDRDVTSLALFDTNNSTSLQVSRDGLAETGIRGEAFITARFDTHTVGSHAIVLPADLQYVAPQVTGNYIDELVGAKLHRLRMLPSDLCSDEEFLRRVSLDIAGSLPTCEEHESFVTDDDPEKRAKVVDRLLQRKEFAEIWAMKWAELLMVKSSNRVSYKAMFLYSNQLTNWVAKEVPLDQMVRDLLSASGGTFQNPATNFYQMETDTLKTAENVAQIFMGIKTQCAQCHNHPFDRWTMDDYYSFAAFFQQVGRKQAEDYRETIVYNRGSSEVTHPVTKQKMPPKFLGGDAPDVKGVDRRVVLADWLTSTDNPFFAKSLANRFWEHYMGVGIVHPVDDIRISNPASNPELLEELGRRLVAYDYDVKKLVRDICNSHAYQRSVVRNDSNRLDERNYAHATSRRLRAEVLLDCISQVTDTEDKFPGLPLGARAVQIADGKTSSYFLTTFGRAARETCSVAEVSTDPSLSQALHMLNGPTIQGKITQGGLIKTWLSQNWTDGQVIRTMYQRALTRQPTAAEVDQLGSLVAEAENRQQGLEDVFWSILNSREFVFNH